jgi:hypothetical protein
LTASTTTAVNSAPIAILQRLPIPLIPLVTLARMIGAERELRS